MLTKSGTSQFHGGAFGLLRSQIFNANDVFNKLVPIDRGMERYNDYGYFLGGPVWFPGLTSRRNSKTFFFFGQEFLRSKQAVLQNISNIPTAAQRAGNFATPVCTVNVNPCPAANQVTQITTIDPTAQAYLRDVINFVPLPNNPNDPQGLIFRSPGTNNETQTLIRIDHQFNSKLTVFFRYLDDPFNLVVPNGFQQTSQVPGVATTAMTNGSTNWLGHVTWVIGTNHVVEGGYATRSNWVTANSVGLLTATRATDVNVRLPFPNQLDHVPALGIGASNYDVNGPFNERSPQSQIFVNTTNSLGRHTLKLGFNVELVKTGSNGGVANAGRFTFTAVGTPASKGTNVFQQAFAQFLQGRVSNFTQASQDIASSAKLNVYEGYVQDDYKMSPRLTLLGGVRYTYFAPPTNDALQGRSLLPVLNFLPSAFAPSAAPALDANGNICTTGTCYKGTTPNPNYNRLNGIIIGGNNSPFGDAGASGQLDNIAPRAGFTADVFGNGRTSLRGGFGLYFFSQIGNPSKFATQQDPPNVLTTLIQNPSFSFPGNGVASFSSSPPALQAYAAGGRSPYSEQYSLDLQQEIHRGTVVDIGYYGNHGLHLFSNVDLNQPTVGSYIGGTSVAAGGITAGNSNALNVIRPFQGYGPITFSSTQFFSKYNSLQTSFRQRFTNGLLLTLNYTWSKTLTNNRSPQDRFNLGPEYGPAGNDRRNVFNGSFIYRLPFFRQQRTLISKLAGGYEFSGIVTYGSGLYSTATIGATDPGGLGLLTGGPGGARPDQVGAPNYNAPHSFLQWFNKSAFVPTPAGQYRAGNAPVQDILNPGYGVWNLTTSRNFRLGERGNLQLRAEAFNVFNHTNFSAISTVVGASNYGQVTAAGDKRSMQFTGRFTF